MMCEYLCARVCAVLYWHAMDRGRDVCVCSQMVLVVCAGPRGVLMRQLAHMQLACWASRVRDMS